MDEATKELLRICKDIAKEDELGNIILPGFIAEDLKSAIKKYDK